MQLGEGADAPLDDFAYSGHVRVAVDITESHDWIAVHAGPDVHISAFVVQQGDMLLPATSIDVNEEDERDHAIARFSGPLEHGAAVLLIDFTSQMNDRLRGLYRSSYRDQATGNTHWLAVTQHEATSARWTMPCFDEPNLKATFEVTITAPATANDGASVGVLSNMPADSTTMVAGKRVVHFPPTPPMSTYLLALLVSTFEATPVEVTRDSATPIEVRVWARPDIVDNGLFAANISTYIIDEYARFFDTPYPLPKSDIVAVPDFAAGAMENWGLITYRETAVLYDPAVDSAATKDRVALVVSHELAHQWFGNLVTMKWWDDLFLNEGFASMVEIDGTDFLFPEWDAMAAFLVADQQRALGADALVASHPIIATIDSNHRIEEGFDGITYSKASSVLRMIRGALGRSTFRQGLITYLNAFTYSNAEHEDLWAHLATASGRPVSNYMEAWTADQGYPLVTVADVPAGPGTAGDQHLQMGQEWFLLDERHTSNAQAAWWIPIKGQWSDGEKFEVDMDELTHTYEPQGWKGTEDSRWYILNADGHDGLFRVNYPLYMWNRLAAALSAGELPTEAAMGLVNDAEALAMKGRLPWTTALEVVAAAESSTHYALVETAMSAISHWESLLRLEPCYGRFSEWASTWLGVHAARLGWTPSNDVAVEHGNDQIRGSLLAFAAEVGNDDAINQAWALYNDHVENHTPIDADLANAVFDTVVREGGEDEWNHVWGMLEGSDDAAANVRYMHALAESRHPHLIRANLDAIIAGKIRTQDATRFIVYNSRNFVGGHLTWTWVKDNWDSFLLPTFGGGQFALSNLVAGSTDQFVSRADLDDVEAFFASVDTTGAEREVAAAVERVRIRVQVLEDHPEICDAWPEVSI